MARRIPRSVAARSAQTLGIDVGGSHLKASVLEADGRMVVEPTRVATPHPATPARILSTLIALVAPLPAYHCVSVGFPGVIRRGVVLTAPNLGTAAWQGYPLADALAEALGKPARVLNDADVQGLGTIEGQGLECVLTLGTGVGSAFFRDGDLLPHLELGQHPLRKHATYDEYLGAAALDRKGRKRWNRRLRRVIDIVRTLSNYDILHLGGGNAEKIDFRLPAGVRLAANAGGITGGIRLWEPRFDALFDGAPLSAGDRSTSREDGKRGAPP